MIVYEQNIYMFGGETSFASADESPLWQFNIAESRWSKILVKNVLVSVIMKTICNITVKTLLQRYLV